MKRAILILLAFISIRAWALYDVTTTDKLRVWAEFPEHIIADGTTVNYIKVFEHDDDDINFTAFNMEFILPEGFRVNQVKQGRVMVDDIFFSDRATPTHSIACNIINGVDLRIIGDSTLNLDLFNDDEDGNPLDELFTIGLIAEPTIATGEYEIKMEGIKFCLSNADARIPANSPLIYKVFIDNPETTGIIEISADKLDSEECYTLSGLKIDPTKVHHMIVVCKGTKYYIR